MTDSKSVRKTVIVPLSPEDAFDLFTTDMDRWWPKDSHSISARSGDGSKATVRVEGRTGGSVVEVLPDGSESKWATISQWEPGTRFAMLWYVGDSPEKATLVDVRFSPTEAGTRVDLTHSGFEVHGAASASLRSSYNSGWEMVLGRCYRDTCMAAGVA